MRTSVKKLPKSQIELEIEVPSEEFNSFIEKAILDLGKDLEIEGFRKGHVPKEIIEREIGQGKILTEAGQLCIKENYLKATLENKIEAISQPEVEILKLAPDNPFVFKAKIQVLPEVQLPDYKKIASQVQKKEVSVSKEEVERLKLEKERMEKERVRQEILEKIAQNSKIEIPEVLIESEKRRMLEDLKKRVPQVLQISFEDYLKKTNKTEKELLESFLPEAEKGVKNPLILKAIGKKEEIRVSKEEVAKEADRLLGLNPNLKNLDQEQLKEYAKEVTRNEKTFKILENLCT